jgi:hypothetical protein
MSNLTLYINNSEIESKYIVSHPKEKIVLNESGRSLPGEFTLSLDNTDKSIFDDRYQGSFFYGTEWYGDLVEYYDNDTGEYIFTGKLIDIEADDANGLLNISASSPLADLRDKICIYSSTTDTTPAEHIYNILTDEDNGNIDPSLIIFADFQNAINIQDANSVYYNIDFDADKNKKILDVISELADITQSSLYTEKNKIKLHFWQPYSGGIGYELPKRFVMPNTYKQNYDDKDVVNTYSIVYDNAGTRAYATGSDSWSVATYGERVFSVPKDTVDSTDSTAFNIICKNSTGADYLGALAINRYKNRKKLFSVKYEGALNYIPLGGQLDLNYDEFVREPTLITVKEYDREKQQISIQGEFSNLPVNYISRDTEAPIPPELISVVPSGVGGVILKWTKSTETDWLGYKIYFTATPGMWYQDLCNRGMSPIDAKIDQISDDGYIYLELSQLNPGTQYYFKVTAYDTSFNESDFSNTKSCTIWLGDYFNSYCCGGNFATGITLDDDNGLSGTVPSDFETFPYILPFTLQPCAIYESGLNYNISGMTKISWRGYCDIGDITFQWRYSSDMSTWSSWSTPVDAAGNNEVLFNSNTYVQFRFIYYSNLWVDSDKIIVKELY